MKRWVVFIYLLGCLMSCKQHLEEQAIRKPNIVIIFTDDQGYNDVGVYGSKTIRTPHLDRMAQEGLRFSQFYVSQPVCSASRASLLTGCYSNRIGIHQALMPEGKKGINEEEYTLAEMLKDQGYKTAVFGKWHLGHLQPFLPNNHGFDEFYGIPYSNDMWPLHPSQGKYFDFPPLPLIEGLQAIDTLEDQSDLTKNITERAVDFIERHQQEPFFLYVPHPMPHVPLYSSKAFRGKSPHGPYADVIEEIDESVGQILGTLKTLNLDENTLVIFASDNGPWLQYGTHGGSAFPLREGKGTVFEGGVRVPCIVRWPGMIHAGRVVDEPAMTIDLFPTIAEIVGAKLPERSIDGVSIAETLLGEQSSAPHHEAYYFYYNKNELQAVLSGDGQWKLYLPHNYNAFDGLKGNDDGLPVSYRPARTELELYHLTTDISETTNLVEKHADKVKQLMSYAEKARVELGDLLTNRDGSGVRAVGEL